MVSELTEFELFIVAWFRTNVNQFAFDAHLVGDLIKELGLKKETRPIFLRAVNMIYQNDLQISAARARKDARK